MLEDGVLAAFDPAGARERWGEADRSSASAPTPGHPSTPARSVEAARSSGLMAHLFEGVPGLRSALRSHLLQAPDTVQQANRRKARWSQVHLDGPLAQGADTLRPRRPDSADANALARLVANPGQDGITSQETEAQVAAVNEAFNPGTSSSLDLCGFTPLCGDAPLGDPHDAPLIDPSAAQGMELGDGWDKCSSDLIRSAWSLLASNDDLVEWALCMGRASDRIDCMLDQLHGRRRNIQINLGNYDARMRTVCFLHCRIDIGTDTQYGLWDIARELFCSGVSTGACAQCAVVAVACSLLHELVHVCGGNHPRDDPTTFHDELHCTEPYLTGAYFAEAIFQRYANGAGQCPCCRKYLADLVGTSMPGLVEDCYTSPGAGGPPSGGMGGGGGHAPSDPPWLHELPPSAWLDPLHHDVREGSDDNMTVILDGVVLI